jgi:hypothetical protein
LVFNKSQFVSILQVVFRGVFWSEAGLSFLRMMGETVWRLEAFCWSPSLWRSSMGPGGIPLSALWTSRCCFVLFWVFPWLSSALFGGLLFCGWTFVAVLRVWEVVFLCRLRAARSRNLAVDGVGHRRGRNFVP